MADFFVSADDSKSAFRPLPHLRGQTVRVAVRRGDDVLRELGVGRVAVCKLDVEGGELDVLRGLHETLRGRRIGCLRLEINRPCCARAGHSPEDLLAELSRHGYTMTAESRRRYEGGGWDIADFTFAPEGGGPGRR